VKCKSAESPREGKGGRKEKNWAKKRGTQRGVWGGIRFAIKAGGGGEKSCPVCESTGQATKRGDSNQRGKGEGVVGGNGPLGGGGGKIKKRGGP